MSKYIISRTGLESSGLIVDVDEKYEPLENKIDSPLILCTNNDETYLLAPWELTKCQNNKIDEITIKILKQSRPKN